MSRFVIAFLLLTGSVYAQSKFEYWPGAVYDPSVPTAHKVLGYDLGDRVSPPDDVVKYMEALAAANPTRMKVWDYGKTWEGRRLIYAAIGSVSNIKRLNDIRDEMQRLADPRRTSDADAKRLIASLPAVIWLSYGIHGNEISSSDAALMTAYHLLASRGDKTVEQILSQVVVLIDPMQNPDGRNRFVHDNEVAEGLEPDPNPLAAEHSESWPGGRTNHYYFDMNRDWLAITQPEVRGQIDALKQWLPLVFVDLHEMGTDGTYYFAPDAPPINPDLTREQEANQEWFGKNNARYFDRLGFNYFTREVYDAFYPGYGASWPAYYGGIAMTYENGSTRGKIVRKSDGQIVRYRDTVRRHFTTSISTAEVSAEHRTELLEAFRKYRVTAIEEGSKGDIREYILARSGDVSTVDKLAQLLVEHGIEVKRATAAFTNGKAYPAGSYVVSLAQPAKRLIRVLLDTQVSMDEDFLKAEEHRRERRLGSEIYDVTAWSLPLQYNVAIAAAASPSTGSFEEVKAGATIPGSVAGKTSVAYIVPWGTSAASHMMTALLHAGYTILSNDRPFTLGGTEYGMGALVLKVKDNPPSLNDDIHKLAQSTGADVRTTDSSWPDSGPTFGSQFFTEMHKPAIVMAWDRPTNGGSAGATRFVLERQYGYPVTVIRTQQLGNANLSQFQTLILPEAGGGEGYAGVLGANGGRRLRDWVQGGGTVIAIGNAINYLASLQLLSTEQENAPREGGATQGAAGRGRGGDATAQTAAAGAQGGRGGDGAGAGSQRAAARILTNEHDYEVATQPDSELPGSLHGALARIHVDREHWIAAGVPETVYALVAGRAIYQPVKADRGINAAIFASADQVLASGYMWQDYRRQLAFKPFLIVERSGRGNVIGFTADPNYRGYMDGLNTLFLNAVFRGPAHAGGGGGRGGQE